MESLLGGMVIGLSVAAPPGPNAALCMAHTLAAGRCAGMRAGFGAASAHAVYATLAVVGVGHAATSFAVGAGAVRVVAGVVLVALGVRLGLTRARQRSPSARAFATTLGLGLANPLTLLYFTAAVAVGAVPAAAGPLLVVGVFAGSAAWWSMLAYAVAAAGRRLDDRRLAWANRVSACMVCGFGALAIVTVLR